MRKLTAPRHDVRKDRQGGKFSEVLSDPERPSDAVLDLFICRGRRRARHDSERTPLAEVVQEFQAQPPIDGPLCSKHPLGTKRSRQAVGVVARMGMEHHGWKQTGNRSRLWAFEHRWPHLRDRAEGRNHRLPSN
jgi:hypothetical protein